jgi:hypothetical protein
MSEVNILKGQVIRKNLYYNLLIHNFGNYKTQ